MEPRIATPPLRELTRSTSLGFEVIDFAEQILGIDLLPWQKWLFIHGLELKPDKSYRFRTVLTLVARQNGKTTALNILTLWRMIMDGARVVIGTSTNLDYARKSWGATVEMAKGSPEIFGYFSWPETRANGRESLETLDGAIYGIATASRKGGRSLSVDLLILDEIREHHTWDAWSASSKTTNARPRGQRWAISNMGDDKSVVLNHLQEKAIAGEDPSLAIFEWSAPAGCDTGDRSVWPLANPALGHTISEDVIASDHGTDTEEVFRTEVLCQRVPRLEPLPLTLEMWRAQLDPASMIITGDPVVFSAEVALDHSSASVGVAGWREGGTSHVGLIAQDYGTDWLLPKLLELVATNKTHVIERAGKRCAGVVIDPSSPAASLIDPLRKARVEPLLMTARDVATACSDLQDEVTYGTVWHRDQLLVDVALQGAVKRDLGDGGWAFGRRKSAAASVDVTPIVAVANARWGLSVVKRSGSKIF